MLAGKVYCYDGRILADSGMIATAEACCPIPDGPEEPEPEESAIDCPICKKTPARFTVQISGVVEEFGCETYNRKEILVQQAPYNPCHWFKEFELSPGVVRRLHLYPQFPYGSGPCYSKFYLSLQLLHSDEPWWMCIAVWCCEVEYPCDCYSLQDFGLPYSYKDYDTYCDFTSSVASVSAGP